MAGLEAIDPEGRNKRRHNDHDDSDAETSSSKKKSRRSSSKKRRDNVNSSTSDGDSTSQASKRDSKKKKKQRKLNGHINNSNDNAAAALTKYRRGSLSQPARDPRDSGGKQPPKKTEADDGSETRSPSPMVDFDGLSRPSRGTRERLDEGSEQAQQRLDKMQGAMRTILECVGEDAERPGILDTPRRYAEAMLFFTKGYQQNVRDLVNNAIFQEGHNEMVVVKDIEIFSLCEHHLVPFTGKMHIAYIPKDQVIGISKLPRIAEMFSRRLQIQERLTKEVANAIMEVLKPQGVAVVMESSHLCMVMRGVQKTTTSTITSCVLGCFERKSKTRNEFLSLVGLKT